MQGVEFAELPAQKSTAARCRARLQQKERARLTHVLVNSLHAEPPLLCRNLLVEAGITSRITHNSVVHCTMDGR